MTDLVPVSERVEGPTVLGDPRERWLGRRRELVTASDVAAILGYDPRRSALSVYAEKVGAVESQDNDWMAFGRDVEGAVAKAYHRRTKRPVIARDPYELAIHPDLPWFAATPDSETAGTVEMPAPAPAEGPAPLECKAVGGIKAADWEDAPPVHFQIQLQAQMACTGAQWGSLVALIGGINVVWKDILRNDRFLANALPRLEEFHLRVQRREPPTEVDALEATSRAVRALFSDQNGETVPLDYAALGIANRWEKAKALATAATDEAEELENALRLQLGPATFGALLDGSFLTLKETTVRGYVREVKPNKYRALRRWRPRLRRR